VADNSPLAICWRRCTRCESIEVWFKLGSGSGEGFRTGEVSEDEAAIVLESRDESRN
jgi:hypothetical protein